MTAKNLYEKLCVILLPGGNMSKPYHKYARYPMVQQQKFWCLGGNCECMNHE